MDVVVPRLNANEDEVLVAQVMVAAGAPVAEGQLLFVVESTKAASEVHAPAAGTVSELLAEAGAMAEVGSVLCRLGGAAAAPVAAKTAVSAEPTLKARLRAAELGIELAGVKPEGERVTVADVERHAQAHGLGPRTAIAAIRPGRAVIVGGGGHAATVYDALLPLGWEVVGCTDARLAAGTTVVETLKIIGDDAALERLLAEGVTAAFLGVGGAVDNGARARVFETLSAMGFALPSFVHPRAHVGLGTLLGAGTQVFAGAVIGPRVTVGADVIVNQGVQLCHDSSVGDHAHLAPGAIIAGGCAIGAGTTIGMAATVLFGAQVGRDCLVHNGAAVLGRLGDGIELRRDGTHAERGR
jgi:sugar O-acyltransferase (sialic acid O-acetyltransferase NeuD family)